MFGAIAGGIASALAGGAMSKLFGGGQKAASGGIQGDVLATDNNTVGMGRSEERFSRNAETDLVCRLLLEKKKKQRRGGGHDRSSCQIINGGGMLELDGRITLRRIDAGAVVLTRL